MIFFQLLEKDIFGGRVMVTKTHQKKEDSNEADADHLRRADEPDDPERADRAHGELNEPS